jgi:hypothetical protein
MINLFVEYFKHPDPIRDRLRLDEAMNKNRSP